MSVAPRIDEPVTYPESDGRPMSDNTVQFRWITTLVLNIDALRDDFVAGDLLWYPVEGRSDIRVAPDVLVALGRPKGDRGSYRQWEEGGVAPAVVMEVLSPNNTAREMIEKLAFYDRYGVQEFYVLDPDVEVVERFVRRGGVLGPTAPQETIRSSALGLTFERADEKLVVRGPDGSPFRSFGELMAERDSAAAERDAAAAERDAAKAQAERLAARLRALGVDPDEV